MQWEDYRATWTLMLGLAATTFTGFLREAALAHELGAGRATDIYLIAFAVPEFAFVALPIVLSPAFIPLFAEVRLHTGEEAAWRFALQVGGALLALLLGLVIVLAWSAPLYVRWLAPGLERHETTQAARAVQLMSPAICLMGGATIAGAVLQMYRRFAPSAMATALYNLAFVAVLLALPLSWPVGRTAWGVMLGATAALLVQLPLLWRHRPPSHASERQGGSNSLLAGVRDVVRLSGPLAAAYAVHHTVLFVDRGMATTLGGGVAATLHYAYRLALVVGQLSGLAVSTALFPRMAEQAANQDLTSLRSTLAQALRFVWMIGLPATCGLIAMRTPVVRLLFEHGAFDTAATATVSNALVFYASAVLADALCQPLWRVLYALHSAGTVLAVNCLQTGARILLNIALIHRLGYIGLALSAALGLSIQALVLGRLARRYLGAYLSTAWWRGAMKIVLASGLTTMAASLMVGLLSAWPVSVALLLSSALGGLTYTLGLRFL